MEEKYLNKIQSDLDQKVRCLSALYNISSALNSIVDRDELLHFIIKKTKELLNVEGSSVILWDERDNMFFIPVVAEETKEKEKRLKQFRFSVNKGIAGWVFKNRKPALVNDVDKDERFFKDIDENTQSRTRSILCIPLTGMKGPLGVIEAINKKDGQFTEDDQMLLIAMADNIATSIEKSELYHELQRAEAILRRQNAELRRSLKKEYSFKNIIGSSEIMIDLIKRAEQVALSDVTLLIYGETGTGKELLAHAIHNCSPRASRNFIAINCGAIPENLLESELFGHEKGAFTAAITRRIGRFEEAGGGTFFLDEIGDMPLSLQVKLLRVLQEGMIQRLGSNLDIPIDVRVIAATNKDLKKLLKEGRFRQDLYYRLKVIELEISPLREHREDIPVLIDHFIKSGCKIMGKRVEGIDHAALMLLSGYNYPGNVRELQHIIERALIMTKGKNIGVDSLPDEVVGMRGSVQLPRAAWTDDESIAVPRDNEGLKAAKAMARKDAEDRIERAFIIDLLCRTKGNIAEAARQAKMNRSWLAQLVGRHNIDVNVIRKKR